MDKDNVGEQLNRAFEAYRQACKEKENIKKTLEQKISALEQELATKKQTIVKLQLQSASTTPRGNVPGEAPVMNTWSQIKESDLLKMRRNEAQHPATCEPPDELKITLERERHCKEQLATENSRLKEQIKDYQQKQKELKRGIEEKDHELSQLRNELKEYTDSLRHGELLYCVKDVKAKWKTAESSSKKAVPLTGTDHHPLYKGRLDFAFQEVCQEFKQLCALTKKQTELLSKHNCNKEVINMPFSMPIQCTDEGEQEHLEEHFVGQNDKSMPKSTNGTRGHRTQQEQFPVVESLSDLDVKFPPSDNDYDFLNSAPEKLRPKAPFEDPPCKVQEVLLKDDIQDLEHKNKEECTLFETFTVGPANKATHNPFCDEQGISTNINTSIGTTVDKTTFRSPSSPPVLKPSNPFLNVESDPMVSPVPTEIRGPQQPVWNPYHNIEGELLHQASKDSDLDLNSKICEFCQAAFPAGTTSREDFLRHLNSHFVDVAKNGS
ncbi:TRAF family member-associated NF-kappa-B activator isoform X1 [Carcharodon carcharias]|uniref:TRAF family member-associated NF-kappa-B activator isoform X1 n=1 Tax=Carcharodon carcharias TaxID=13397 RepID=UPI001B7DE088|nr:TRAF family member-associated NF-kappa-B activator isoform X1 [Carcharodon carcharias]XP_041057765.1 TRAF family member-associated NF-kappa-B activator isoform X1 [Carcharodon carcharias]XP_041057766.1 TRAF family member-associated NF-kappa-B activator isoform X1 [Carcharodon carcharias]XP_041057767.1 TRAF family member-associated NF-kappa-B activator isoform X1 [Carcharodon carcharias]